VRHCAASASSTAHRAKVRNLRRDRRTSLYVTVPGGGSYAVAEGTAAPAAVATTVSGAANTTSSQARGRVLITPQW
jgi:hypothetical protein